MALLNSLVNIYRQIIPQSLRKKISPKVKNKLKEIQKSKINNHFSNTLGLDKFNSISEKLNLLNIFAKTQEKRMLMIVGNMISMDSRVLKSAQSMKEAGFHVLLVGIKPTIDQIELTNFGSIPALLLDSSAIKKSNDPVLLTNSIFCQLSPVIEFYDPTHVYSHDFFGLSFVSESLGALNYRRYCHWTHDIHEYAPGLEGAMDSKKLKWVKKLEAQRLSVPDNIIVVNEDIRDLMAKVFSPHQRIDVLHNFPLKGTSSSFNLRTHCKIDKNTPLAVYTGRSTKLRGLDLIIPALVQVPDLHVALLSQGAKPYLEELKEKAKNEAVESRLHIFPYLPNEQVAAGISSADFGIAPFTRYGNTDLALATKLFEYIHAGLPIVASNCTAMEKFINGYGCGEIFKSEDASEFITAIQKILSKPKSAYSISKQKLKDFSWEEQIKPIVNYMKTTDTFDKSKMVFHGPGPSAGQPRILSAEMQSEGIKAYCINIVSNTTFDYNKDIFFPYRDGIRDPKHLMHWASKRFGVFHFYFRTISNYITDGEISKEIFQDIQWLKASGAKVVMHFRGTEVRVQSIFEQKNKYAWDMKEDTFPKGDVLRRQIIDKSRGLFDKLLVTDPELQTYVENSKVLQRAIDFEIIDTALQKTNPAKAAKKSKKIRIAHAPSRRAQKGTETVQNIIQNLIDEGYDLELDIIENVTNQEVLMRIAKADLVIDQMRIGWYGVLAVEAMALSKPTIAYIRDDLIDQLEKDCPILVSNPEALKDDLRIWINDRKNLIRIGNKSRQFAKTYHCSKVVAQKALEIYGKL